MKFIRQLYPYKALDIGVIRRNETKIKKIGVTHDNIPIYYDMYMGNKKTMIIYRGSQKSFYIVGYDVACIFKNKKILYEF